MDKQKVDEALEKSIAHWEQLAAARDWGEVRIGGTECALCGVFNRPDTPVGMNCIGCPVREKTGWRYCDGAPYGDAAVAYRARDFEAFIESAQDMVAFLKSLRKVKSDA